MARLLLLICLGLALVALAAGYGLGGQWAWLPLIGGLGALWLIGYWRRWGWVASLGLAGFAGMAAAGSWLDLGAGWMVLGLAAALSAWDLHRFVLCLGGVEQVEARRTLEQHHLRRLLAVTGLGLLLSGVAVNIELRLSFFLALLLGLLAAWGLSRAVGFLRREGE